MHTKARTRTRIRMSMQLSENKTMNESENTSYQEELGKHRPPPFRLLEIKGSGNMKSQPNNKVVDKAITKNCIRQESVRIDDFAFDEEMWA